MSSDPARFPIPHTPLPIASSLTGVVLCTYGEPRRNSFLDHWLYSYRLLTSLTRKIANIPALALPVIATGRAWRRVQMWKKRSFVSPLEPLTEQTAQALQVELNRNSETSGRYLVAPAYEFRRPMLAEVLSRLQAGGCQRFILMPMYVGGGDFTIGITRQTLQDAHRKLPWLIAENIKWASLSGSPQAQDQLAELMAAHVLRSAREKGIQPPASDWALLLAAHGTLHPASVGLDNSLPSICAVGCCLSKKLRKQFGTVRFGWLNHSKGGRWTQPALPQALIRLRKAGFQKLLYFPWGFTTDNAESALEGRLIYQSLPGSFSQVEHLPCLNLENGFIRFLAERIEAEMTKVPVAPASRR